MASTEKEVDFLAEPKNPLKRYGIFGWNWWYLMWRPWVIVRECYDHTKWFFQRGWRGYADCDTWSLCSYLDSWMPAAIEKLTHGHGHPMIFCPDNTSDGCTHDQDHLKEWHAILRKMADGFRASKILDGHGCWAARHDRMRKGLEEKQQEGLALFVKYYGCLWD